MERTDNLGSQALKVSPVIVDQLGRPEPQELLDQQDPPGL